MGFSNIINVFDEIPNDPVGKSWFDAGSQIEWPVVGKYYWQFCLKVNNRQ
jgi:hypothetical protein